MALNRNLDEFESVFRRADKPLYEPEPIRVERAFVLTDLSADAARDLAGRIRGFLAHLIPAERVEWRSFSAAELPPVHRLLEELGESRPDLVATYRNLGEPKPHPRASLGTYVEILTQRLAAPVLVLPRRLDALPPRSRTVLVVSDRLRGDDHLVSWGTACAAPGGRLVLSHLESESTLQRYLDLIGRLPGIDTSFAAHSIPRQLLAEAEDYMRRCRHALERLRPDLQVDTHAAMGRRLEAHRRLIQEHEVDLLVMNTEVEDQLAMAGGAYQLAVEFHGLAQLLL